MRRTVFAHFVAGESAADIAPALASLHSLGVGGILDYAAEVAADKPVVVSKFIENGREVDVDADPEERQHIGGEFAVLTGRDDAHR